MIRANPSDCRLCAISEKEEDRSTLSALKIAAKILYLSGRTAMTSHRKHFTRNYDIFILKYVIARKLRDLPALG